MSQEINTGLWYGDFYSPNDNYTSGVEKKQRRRFYYAGENWNGILRVEMSKSLIQDLLNPLAYRQEPKM